MPVTRLTKRTVDALPYPDTGQELYRDQSLPGFGLRVGTRSKVFFAEGQVQRRTVRVTIGRADLLSPEIDLAADVGIDMRYLGGIERGQENPTIAVVANIAKALGVHPSVLLIEQRGKPQAALSVQHLRAATD